MNIALFTEEEIFSGCPFSDPRIRHVLRVLKLKEGESFRAGIENGKTGIASIVGMKGEIAKLDFRAEGESLKPAPLALILGFPRPIQAGRLFKDLASLGVGRIILTQTELGEKSYAESDFFKNREWLFFLREGLMQAGTTILPEVERFWRLEDALDSVRDAPLKLAMDNMKPEYALSDESSVPAGTVAAAGSERGWTDRERVMFQNAGFGLRSLGKRILKTETAALVSCALLLSKMGEL